MYLIAHGSYVTMFIMKIDASCTKWSYIVLFIWHPILCY